MIMTIDNDNTTTNHDNDIINDIIILIITMIKMIMILQIMVMIIIVMIHFDYVRFITFQPFEQQMPHKKAVSTEVNIASKRY